MPTTIFVHLRECPPPMTQHIARQTDKRAQGQGMGEDVSLLLSKARTIPMKTLANPIRKRGWCVRLYLLYVFFTLPKWRSLLSNGASTVKLLNAYKANVVLMTFLVTSFTLPAYAQEKLWHELIGKANTLHQQRLYP